MFLKNLLLAYQLENYETLRFLRFISTHLRFWIIGSSRQELIWTLKIRGILTLSIFLSLSTLSSIIYQFGWVGGFFCILATIALFPAYMIVANFFLLPIDIFLKYHIIQKARKKLKNHPNLTIIGITGSYGKTSQKEILKTILSTKYKVLSTEGNKNTPLGVSDIILSQLGADHEVFIVEMGAYQKGDIQELCNLVHPKIGILTGITVQHLERFENIENIVKTKFELIDALPEDGLALCDISNQYIQKELINRKDGFKVKTIQEILSVDSLSFRPHLAGIDFCYDQRLFSTKLLARHNLNQIITAYEIARYLGISHERIREGIEQIDFVPHRLQLIYNPQTQVSIIDDSYNGNLEGVKSIIEILAHTTGFRRLYLTPGLVELGNHSDDIHREIGAMLAPVIEVALLIESPATQKITEGLRGAGFPEKQIILYPSTQEAHSRLSEILRSGDVIVFQNDWTDNYF